MESFLYDRDFRHDIGISVPSITNFAGQFFVFVCIIIYMIVEFRKLFIYFRTAGQI